MGFVGFLLSIALKFSFAVHWGIKSVIFLAGSFGGLLAGLDVLYIVAAGALASVLLM